MGATSWWFQAKWSFKRGERRIGPNPDPDSILVLEFSKVPAGGRVDMVHAGVPQHDHKGVTKGWPHFYWKPWKAYLKERSKG